ncbi:leucine-rich PPR motif-containing protein, mitochondrial-like isoform X2 [Liolophura sinensis]|uniref:leucine-rich PPR motif-containing protein, mitochondrial-like isoform X2 n=1 Tax=Liolophura sinensis TaxID=3198878 RepID=UPI003158CB2B
MKTNEIAINEQVFNFLITGHFRANDLESANGMLDIMQQAGMEPSVETYRAFLNGYAEKGDMEGVKETMKKVADNGLTLTPNILFDVLLTLAKGGYTKEASEILPSIQKFPGYSTEAMSCAIHLATLAQDDLAYQVFEAIGKPVVYDKGDAKLGRFLIRAMVRAERPPEKLSTMLQKMNEAEFNSDTIAITAQMAYLNKQTDFALKILDYMKKEGHTIRTHFFWPAICQYRDKGEKDKLKAVVKYMGDACEGKEDKYQTLEDYIIPAFIQLGVPENKLLAELKDTGSLTQNSEMVNFGLTMNLLKTKGVDEALSFAEKNPCYILYGALKPVLVPLYKRTRDLEAVFKVLKFANEEGASPNLAQETNGWFVMDFLQNTSVKDGGEALFLGMKNKGLKIPKTDVEEVKSLCKRLNIELSPEASEALNSLGSDLATQSTRTRQQGSLMQLGDKSKKHLEDLLQKYPGNKAVQKYLLGKYCQDGDTEKAAELKASLDATGFVYSDYQLRQLSFMESVHSENLQAAESYLTQLKTQFPEYSNYIRALINVSALKIKDLRAEEALTDLQEYCEKNTSSIAEQKFSESYMLQDDCIRILNALSESKQTDLARSFLKLFFDGGLVRSGTASILRTYLDIFIKNDDMDGAIEALDFITTTYTKTVPSNELMKMLIQKEDPERLQKVVDLLTPLRGEMNVLHQLMISFVECGHIKKARKIVETPGLRAVMNVLVLACGQFVHERRLKELEDLVSVTKNLFAVDRDEMLFQKLRYHALEKDWSKALNVLIDYEEEGIQPRARTLRYLAKALEGDGQPVPFDIPQHMSAEKAQEEFDEAERFPFSTVEQKALALIKNGGCTAVIDIKKDLDQSDDKKQAKKFIPTLISALVDKKHFRDIGKLILELSKAGEIETLEELKTHSYPEEVIRGIQRRLLHTYVDSNRGEEILSYLESNPSEVDMYFSWVGIQNLTENYPQLMERVEKLAELTAEQKSFKLTNLLWSQYFCQDDTSKAEAILKKHPEMLETLRVANVCSHAMRTKDEEKLLQVADIVKGNEGALKIVYRNLLMLHSYNDNADGILKVIEKLAEEKLTTDILNVKNRNKLIEVFQSQNKPIPSQLAFVQQKDSSPKSSESSSSSSDDEAKSAGR